MDDYLKQLAARVVDPRLQAGRGDEFSAGARVSCTPSLRYIRPPGLFGLCECQALSSELQ